MEDEVRVIRIIEYTGPRSWVEKCIERSIHGTKIIEGGSWMRQEDRELHREARITAVTLGEYPQIMAQVAFEGDDPLEEIDFSVLETRIAAGIEDLDTVSAWALKGIEMARRLR